ncbi:hypothetical protein Y032_0452g1701 [Ancylostoma ceylanicum]|uniref:Uncharacterized protein n=1 Tax=Ancylostoma ceylanicum TaxID=53326 RepID=A0A016WYJ5_9BILA|nr:hypothetical protein Y032_0452g1701 [Ancylostoma ceylanicum]
MAECIRKRACKTKFDEEAVYASGPKQVATTDNARIAFCSNARQAIFLHCNRLKDAALHASTSFLSGSIPIQPESR